MEPLPKPLSGHGVHTTTRNWVKDVICDLLLKLLSIASADLHVN